MFFALGLNMCFLVLFHPCGKLALIMSWDPVLNAAIKKGPRVLGSDKSTGVLKLWNAYDRPWACMAWTLDPTPSTSGLSDTVSWSSVSWSQNPFTHLNHSETMKWPQWLLGPDWIDTSKEGNPAGIGLNDENYCAQKESICAFERNSILFTKGLRRQS